MRRFFILLYAASGAAALVYEVAWTRLLTLAMGHTVAAASTVLAAFMGGLALGAWLAGVVVGDRFRLDATRPVPGRHPFPARLLQLYAALELFIALVAIALPSMLSAFAPALASAYVDGTAPLRYGTVRLVVSLAAIGLPAAAMGATFPIAAEWFADAGALYAANTAGAAAGALASGFWLLPALGLRGTTWVGVALNVVAAAWALWMARVLGPTEISVGAVREPPLPDSAPISRKKGALRAQPSLRLPWSSSSPQPVLACVAVAVSGFTALVYEVAWTRLLALVLGPTTYAFATMVASFVAGLAIGSAAGARLARRTTQPAVWLGGTLIAGAVATAAAAAFAAARLPLMVADQVADPNAMFVRIVAQQAVVVAALMLPSTFALGAAFPLALASASGDAAAVGRDAARVYASNTLGAIAGALAGGFVLLPALGLQATLRAAAGAGIAAGAIVWIAAADRSRERSRRNGGALRGRSAEAFPPSRGGETNELRRGWPKRHRHVGGTLRSLAAAAAAWFVLTLPAWDRELLTSGAYKYAPYMDAVDRESALRAGRIEYYEEGAASTVAVRRLAGTRSMSIDGKVDASDGGDMVTQRLLGLLPSLLHREPHDVCVIGLGSGVTADAALASGTVQRADVVEISPQVVEASSRFVRENGNVLKRPGVNLIVGDGRTHLLLTKRRYDVIVSEPSNPWMAGVAALFTREFFEAARARLNDEGLLCQWAHTYDISDQDLRSIVRTFTSVFPQGTMWLVGEGDLLLIGTTGPSIETHLGGIGQYAKRGTSGAFVSQLTKPIAVGGDHVIFESPLFELLSLYAGGPRELAEFGGSAPVQIDDRMALEFSAPRGIYGRTTTENSARIRNLLDEGRRPPAVRAVLGQATDRSWAARGAMNLKAEAYAPAYDDFRRAVSLNPRNAAALAGLSDAAAGARRQREERTWLESLAAAAPDNAAVRIELSRLLAVEGNLKGAAEMAEEARRIAPSEPAPLEQLASVLADAGDADRLGPLAQTLLRTFPQRTEPLYYHASALYMTGRAREAAAEVRQIIERNRRHARAQNLLGAACATLGERDCAQAAFEASLEADPRDPSTYVNLALFRLQIGDPRGAAGHFAEALTLDPSSTAARNGLAQARAASKLP